MVLTLATANECADAILFFDNDDVMARAKLQRKQTLAYTAAASGSAMSVAAVRAQIRAERSGKADDLRISTWEVNDVIATSLAGVLLPMWHRKALSRGARKPLAHDSAASKRPGWVDVAEEAKQEEAATAVHDPLVFGSKAGPSASWQYGDEEEEEADGEEAGSGRTAWIRGSSRAPGVASSSYASGARVDAMDDVYERARGGICTPIHFDAAALISMLCPSTAMKYLDVRSASNVFPAPPPPPPVNAAYMRSRHDARHVTVCAGMGWADVADNLSDVVVRYDRDSKPVTCVAAHVIARGASTTDCDSVDPSVESSLSSSGASHAAAGGGGGGGSSARASTAQGRLPLGSTRTTSQWPGLPDTDEWRVVGQKMMRMFTMASGSSGSGSRRDAHVHAHGGAAADYRSAELSPPPASPFAHGYALGARSLTAVSNSDAIIPTLLQCAERVEALLRASAYVHWYARFGVTSEHIQAATESVLNVVDAYSSLRAPATTSAAPPRRPPTSMTSASRR